MGMTATANASQIQTACTCGAAHCETMIANCKICKTRGPFHVVQGDTRPVEFWECENPTCGATYERKLMSDRAILAEARRGF
jgi:hypothetical protein